MADCLSRIRNASFRYFEEITVTYSRPVHDLLDQLCDGGYISSYHVYEETSSQGRLVSSYASNDSSHVKIS